MSDLILTDGTGNNYKARVTPENRIETLTVTETIAAHHAFDGEAYNINTGNISLSSGNKTACWYLKNNDEKPLVITSFFYLLGANTDGSGDTLVQIERNPTGGDLISGGTAFVPVNRDFGSNSVLDATCLKGAEGDALTGGTVVIESLFNSASPGRQTISVGAIVLRQGNSIGVTVTPATSTSAMDVQIAAGVYRATESTES
jgi:hypothetical protein